MVISPELAKIIAEAALTEPYRQIKPLTTKAFQKWLWKLDIKFMNWQTLHYLWANGVVIPVAVTEQAINETPGLVRDRFAPVLSLDGNQLYGDLGVEIVDLPALTVGRDDFPGLATSLWWHPFQLFQFYRIEWLIHQNWTLDTYLRDADDDFAAWTNGYRDQHRRSLSSAASDPEHDDFRRFLPCS